MILIIFLGKDEIRWGIGYLGRESIIFRVDLLCDFFVSGLWGFFLEVVLVFFFLGLKYILIWN